MEWSANLAALDLHRGLNLTDTNRHVLATFTEALKAAYERGWADQRQRIVEGIEAEADATPDPEDAGVTRGLAWLVRADFSYEDAERLEAEAEATEALTEQEYRNRLDAELAVLNKAVGDSITARRAWMDQHMTDYARYRIGETLYDLDTGRELGVVSALYRLWGEQDDPRYDTRMNVEYRIAVSGHANMFDNTSRQPGLRYGNANDLARDLERRASAARERAGAP